MSTAKVAKGKKKKAGTPAPDEVVTEKVLDTKGLLAKDLANMMYGFGDDRTPHKESVDLVEDMVINYVVDTWQKTLASAHSRSTKVSEKDVIFLLRKVDVWQSAVASVHCFPECPDVVAHARWLTEAQAAGTCHEVLELLVPVQRCDSQPHARSTSGVSNILLQEVMPHDVFG